MAVAPLVGARVEIYRDANGELHRSVAPLVGARVEIECCRPYDIPQHVAPLVGARVEIQLSRQHHSRWQRSLPSWERGLKSKLLLTS